MTTAQAMALVKLGVLHNMDAPSVSALLLEHGDYSDYASFTSIDARLEDQYVTLIAWLKKRRYYDKDLTTAVALRRFTAYLSTQFEEQHLTANAFLQRLAPVVWAHWERAGEIERNLYALWSEWSELDGAIQTKELRLALSTLWGSEL